MLNSSARIWSLWDMRELLASGMAEVHETLERIATLLREWEEPLFTEENKFDPTEKVGAPSRHFMAKSYKKVAEAAEILGVPLTSLAASRASKRLLERKDVVTWSKLKAINEEIRSRFQDEFGNVKVYCLTRGADAYYTPEEPLFGMEAEARIPKAANDISEAGKCFATGRYTASVFHLMRAMEAAVQPFQPI